MDPKEQKEKERKQLEYNHAQCREILNFKWTESEKVHHDLYPGRKGRNKAAFDWIKQYAAAFKKFWDSQPKV
ncbi:hypothetical protein KAR91_11185 [Candidatus Pacearchaeota archaeon]|nr:hypothetical protein [Candidatus Pacearchaeota archaeon]